MLLSKVHNPIQTPLLELEPQFHVFGAKQHIITFLATDLHYGNRLII